MSRLLPVVAVIALSLAGCSGDDNPLGTGLGPTSGAQPSSGTAKDEPNVKYADFTGGEVIYQTVHQPVGARMKPIETVWAAEFGGKPAPSGQHFLVVYVAVTPEAADRGATEVLLADLKIRYQPKADECSSQTMTIDGKKHCFHATAFRSDLAELPEGAWHDREWTDTFAGGTDMDKGATMVGVATFAVADTIDALDGYELCAPEVDSQGRNDKFPCTALPAPKKPRG
jgi:hypothetical protein